MTATPLRLPSRAAIAARAAGSAAALLGLLGGVPVFLATQIGWPLPRHLPSWEQVHVWLAADAVDDMSALKLLACIAWIAWAQLCIAIVVEAVAAARHTTAKPIRLLGPAQLLAASLMGALLMLAATCGTTTGGPPATRPAITTEEPAAVAPPPLAPRPVPPPQVDARTGPQSHPGRSAGQGWRAYIVVRGDTLWDIAAAQLGDPHEWPRIYRANAGRPQPDGRVLHNPDLILPGWTLRLPTPTPSRTEPPDPAPGPRHGPRPTAATVAPTPPLPAGAPTHPALLPTPPTPGRHGPATGQHSRPTRPDPGVRLPAGGYAGITLAAAAAAALTVIRLRRRIHHRLDHPTATTAGNGLLPEPLQVLRRIWLAASAPAGRPDVEDAAAVHPPAELADPGTGPVPLWPYPPGVLPVGTYPNGEEHLLAIDAAGGLGLTGAGAAGLTRYLLATVLGAGAPTQHAHHSQVVIPEADLLDLLGPGAAPGDRPPRLVVTATLDQALDRLEAELLSRSRLLDTYHAADVAELRRDHPDEDPLPPLLLICHPSASAGRVQAILSLGARCGIGGLILGPSPSGTTWHLDPTRAPDPDSESAGPPPGMRPYTLTPDETSALLRLWRDAAAATDPFAPPPAQPDPATAEPAGYTLTPVDPLPHDQDRPEGRPVRLRLFGPPTLHIRGVEVTTGLRTLGRALLTYLALHRDGVHGDTLTEALWPDEGPTKPALHPTISRVRALLREHTGLDAAFVTHRHGRYRLDPDLVAVDIWDFADTLAAAPRRGDPRRANALQAAAALYTGPFAQDSRHDWSIAPAEDLRLQAAATLAELAALHEPFDPDQALATLHRALQIDEYNEQLYQRTMILQARLGQVDDIRRTYRQLETRLYELDLQPSQDTEQLRAELLRGTRNPTDRRPPAA